jgi:hypothetical protein
VKTVVAEKAPALVDRRKAAGDRRRAAGLFDASTLRHADRVRAAAAGPKYNA